jgi:hypothetical protein
MLIFISRQIAQNDTVRYSIEAIYLVTLWSGGQVVRWSGGQVVWWSGGKVVRW